MRYRGEDFANPIRSRDCCDLSGLSCNIRDKLVLDRMIRVTNRCDTTFDLSCFAPRRGGDPGRVRETAAEVFVAVESAEAGDVREADIRVGEVEQLAGVIQPRCHQQP